MKIIGHRGASAEAPENTLESLQLAWAQGAYGAECDITRTRDGELILMHDDSTRRTALGGVDLVVAETDWTELKDLDVGSWKGSRWQGVRIPRLEEVLGLIPEGQHLYVEIKSGDRNQGADPRIVDELEALLIKVAVAPEKLTFISFDHDVLNRLKERLPSYRALYLTSYLPFPGRWPDVRNDKELEATMAVAVANNIDGLDMESSPVIRKSWVEKIHAQGLQLTIWSYASDDTLKMARHYQQLGADLYTTNTPALILSALDTEGGLREEDYLQRGRLTPLGVDYLSRFKHFRLFDNPGTLLLFLLSLPIVIPLALLRLMGLAASFGGGLLLKRYLSISLDAYPKLISLIYFLSLGVWLRNKKTGQEDSAPLVSDCATVIVTNHPSRFDAMLLANLHQADATYRGAAKTSFFGRLLIASGLCSRAMEEGLVLDSKEGREEWRQRLRTAYRRPMLLFPEGRVVQKPQTIMTFQNHLLLGQRVKVICRASRYRSYFLDHTQIEIPFFKPPFSGLKNKLLWDSLIEVLPFLMAVITVYETKVIAVMELSGSESLEEIDAALYAPYFDQNYRLVSVDPQLSKKLLQSLYAP